MRVIQARNVHQALPEALYQLSTNGVRSESRNGPVLKFDGPVTTVYEKPKERVLFWPQRDANPFFHVMESLWMLAGRNDVEFVAMFVERMRSFSDDGVTFHGAYGFRWRNWFIEDQLPKIIGALKKDPTDRRQVLSMWDGHSDLGRQGKDLPCNLQAIFSINKDGALDMVVTNRSNDIIWGAYGANAVHFSYLQEYVASCVGVEVGKYWQVSANFHAYEKVLEGVKGLSDFCGNELVSPHLRFAGICPYRDGKVAPYDLMSTNQTIWERDLTMFMRNPRAMGFTDPFFRKVASPLAIAHEVYKTTSGVDKYISTFQALKDVRASDWKMAAEEWVQRRYVKFLKANDDGVVYE